MSLLQKKVAIITGASSGIGRASAILFAREGAKVVLGARRESALYDLAKEITKEGGKAAILAGDVRSETYNQALVNLAITQFGRLDIGFNNAGMLGTPCKVTDLPLADWEQVIATNLTSCFMAAKYQIPAMLKSNAGSLVFTSSFVGYSVGFSQQSAYAASKAGIIGLTKSLASEYGAAGIRINALLPGGTETAMAQDFASNPEVREFVNQLHALKRIAQPEEIANSALYLASELSSFTSGTAMLVDGGVSINRE